MAPRRCTIKDCGSVAGRQEHRGVTFHSFPLNPIARELWIQNGQVPATKTITKSVLICSRHFRRADFQPLKNDKYFLKPGAVPTIFPWGNLPYVEPATPNLKLIHNKTASAPAPAAKISATETASSKEEPKFPNPNLTDPESVISAIKSELKASPLKRSASADEAKSNEQKKKMMRKSFDSAAAGGGSGPSNVGNIASVSYDPVSLFLPGSRIEAQDFNGTWHFAKVVEVDHDEREVLINFEKNAKTKTQGVIDEWISMNSSRLRPVQTVKKVVLSYEVGERCMARWTDSRKFPATVQKILDNNMYEVLFDDGYVKEVRGSHMSKIKSAADPAKVPTSSRKGLPPLPIPKFDLSKLNLLPVPKDGEWCCNWVNDTPIGAEGYLEGPDGHKRPTVLVDDWRLPVGWTKHLYQRSSVSGKWDVVLVGPNKKRFRSKADVKVYLEEIGETYNPDIYDFSIHKRRAKDIGLYIYTDDYKELLKKKLAAQSNKSSDALSSPVAGTSTSLTSCSTNDLFTGFSPLDTDSMLQQQKSVQSVPQTPTSSTNVGIPESGFVYVGALKVQIVDNLFRCPDESCNKNFRKENHLQIHVKHYHEEMAKLMGVCPNMTDLAYLRTVGQPSDEPTPKNQIPNSQFFEKVYQAEMSMKSHRKSMSSPTGIKGEPRTPGVTSTSICDSIKKEALSSLASATDAEKFGQAESTDDIILKKLSKISEDPGADSSFEKTFLVQDCIGYPMQSKPLTPVKAQGMMDAEALIQTHSVTRPSKKASSKRKRFLMKSRPPKSKSTSEDHDDIIDTDDAQYSSGGHAEIPARNQKSKIIAQHPSVTLLSNTTSQTSITEPSPKYINENGEVIKIVRMRQEEIINCLCGYTEEDGLMIQCELCLCWQHGICNGIEKESQVPDKYVCYICQNPWRGRESMRYVHDQDWLFDGKLPIANYQLCGGNRSANPKHSERFDILKQSHTLTGNLLELKSFLHSLNVKINIAANKDHPKMYLWSKKWEKSPQRNEVSGIEPLIPVPPKMPAQLDPPPNAEIKIEKQDRIDDNQIIDILEDKNDDETMSSKKEIESDMKSDNVLEGIKDDIKIEDNVEMQQDDGNKIDEEIKSEVDNKIISTDLNEKEKSTIDMAKEQELNQIQTNIPQPEAAIDSVECQHRLLDHIQKQQSLAMTRLQTIEAHVIALEAMDEKLTSSEPIDSFTRTKDTIYMLLNDLVNMRKFALINKDEEEVQV